MTTYKIRSCRESTQRHRKRPRIVKNRSKEIVERRSRVRKLIKWRIKGNKVMAMMIKEIGEYRK